MTFVLDTPVVCPVLLGRDAPMQALERARERVQAGAGQVVLIAGEAGVGKSRLLAEARSTPGFTDWLTLEGHCFEPDVSFPCGPLVEMLRTRLETMPGEE